MKKLSNKSLEKINIFLNDEEFSYISLTRFELKTLFSIYNSVISLISETEEKKHNLIKYLEDMISIRENYLGTDNANFDTTLEDEIDIIKDILEKVKSGKYE